jgi:hypothetical protein
MRGSRDLQILQICVGRADARGVVYGGAKSGCAGRDGPDATVGGADCPVLSIGWRDQVKNTLLLCAGRND